MGRAIRSITLVAVAVVVVAAALYQAATPRFPLPKVVVLPSGTHSYRPAGEFRIGTHIVDAPAAPQAMPGFAMMTYQVSEADYARCVAAADCVAAPGQGRTDYAQTNVSFTDATAYAGWLSRQTGVVWRLPTDAEWLRAAANRGFDAGFSPEANGADPSRRWIASYRREVARRGAADLDRHPSGYFGLSDTGIADMAGNIWEWTQTCFQNGTLTANGAAIATRSDYCGVRAVQGKHRGFVIDFVRDARTGGCAAGVPPDYLGFRLVRSLP